DRAVDGVVASPKTFHVTASAVDLQEEGPHPGVVRILCGVNAVDKAAGAHLPVEVPAPSGLELRGDAVHLRAALGKPSQRFLDNLLLALVILKLGREQPLDGIPPLQAPVDRTSAS